MDFPKSEEFQIPCEVSQPSRQKEEADAGNGCQEVVEPGLNPEENTNSGANTTSRDSNGNCCQVVEEPGPNPREKYKFRCKYDKYRYKW